RGPQQALWLGALFLEAFPARARKQMLVFLIGELGVGDCNLALQRGETLLLAWIVRPCDLFVELLVDRAVDAADEEAGETGDMGGIAATGDIFLEAGQIGLSDLHIGLLREQQRDVDADTLADQVL